VVGKRGLIAEEVVGKRGLIAERVVGRRELVGRSVERKSGSRSSGREGSAFANDTRRVEKAQATIGTVKKTKPVGVRGRVETGAEDTCEGGHVPMRHEQHQRPAVCNGTREVATPLHFIFFLELFGVCV